MKIITDEQYKTATKEADALLLCGDLLDDERRRRYSELVVAIFDYEKYKVALKELNDLMSIRPADPTRIDELSDFIHTYECDKITNATEYNAALEHIDALVDEMDATGARSLKQMPDGERRWWELMALDWAIEEYEEELLHIGSPPPLYWWLYRLCRWYDRAVYWLRRTIARAINWIDAELWYERALWRPRWTAKMREERNEEARSAE